MPAHDGTLVMEDARIVFRNFAGKEGMYNREGDRNFCVLLEPKLAETMAKDGWNIKTLRPREEGEEGTPYIQVSVGFKGRPPRIVLISSKGRVDLGQHECEILDWVDIKQCDLIIRPYNWSVNGKSGVKAYLKSIFIIMNEDYLELKYAEVPEINRTTQPLAIEGGAQRPDEDIIDGDIVEED